MIDYMPEFYKNHRQFKNCIEFFENNEFGLALESLVELADETEHYFSEEYWKELSKAADKMEMPKTANYCKKESKRTLKGLDYKLPFGWTTYKISENNFKVNISEKLNGEWRTERRKKDEIEKLLNIKLIERTKRRVLLTPLGENISERSQKIIMELNDVLDYAKSSQKICAGTASPENYHPKDFIK